MIECNFKEGDRVLIGGLVPGRVKAVNSGCSDGKPYLVESDAGKLDGWCPEWELLPEPPQAEGPSRDAESGQAPRPVVPPALPDFVAETGAVRSADVSDYDFCSYPLIGLLSSLKVAGAGGAKYGRFNYVQGFPQHEIVNHLAVHLICYALGDRSEPHLEKVMWNAAAAIQNEVLHPELCVPHMPGPAMGLTEALLAELDRGKAERDRRRQAGEFEDSFDWTAAGLPIVQRLLRQAADNAKADGGASQ